MLAVRYPWTGEVVLHSRRDKRRGQHRGSVHRTEAGPCIQCALSQAVSSLLLCAVSSWSGCGRQVAVADKFDVLSFCDSDLLPVQRGVGQPARRRVR